MSEYNCPNLLAVDGHISVDGYVRLEHEGNLEGKEEEAVMSASIWPAERASYLLAIPESLPLPPWNTNIGNKVLIHLVP